MKIKVTISVNIDQKDTSSVRSKNKFMSYLMVRTMSTTIFSFDHTVVTLYKEIFIQVDKLQFIKLIV